MAKNEVYKNADYLSLPVPTGRLSGQPVRVGGLNGVLSTNEGSVDKPAGNYNEAPSSNKAGFASVALVGAFRIPVSTTTTLAIGDPVYIITASNTLTPSSSGNVLFGHALSAKGATDGQPVIVRIAN
jgi:predicted RecA/RadA family phage recombinase